MRTMHTVPFHLSTNCLRICFNKGVTQITRNGFRLGVLQTEDTLDDTELWSGGVQTCDGEVVVDDHTGADDRGTTVDGTGNERNL